MPNRGVFVSEPERAPVKATLDLISDLARIKLDDGNKNTITAEAFRAMNTPDEAATMAAYPAEAYAQNKLSLRSDFLWAIRKDLCPDCSPGIDLTRQ